MPPPDDGNHENEELLPLQADSEEAPDRYANDPVHVANWVTRPINRGRRATLRRIGIRIPYLTTGYESEAEDDLYEFADSNYRAKIK